MKSCQQKQSQWQHCLCTVCNEQWPVRTRLDVVPFVCVRCQRDKHVPKRFSADNDMDPGCVPECLEGMTQVEEMLIARATPIMTGYQKHGGQRGYSCHALNLPQNVQEFVNKLPSNVRTLPLLLITRQGDNDTKSHFTVRREKVLSALQWLQTNNKYYHDIEIDFDAISALLVDGVPNDLLEIQSSDDISTSTDYDEGPPIEELTNNDAPESCNNASTSFLPLSKPIMLEENAIHSQVAGHDPLEWPTIEQNALNEFSTEGMASMAFPTLFPYGKGDPTSSSRHYKISHADAFKHLIRYADQLPCNQFHWRFASHPRFPYWALNMKHRHQLLSQSKVYIQHNPGDAELTIEELREMVGTMSSVQLMNKLQHYAAKVQGSRQYWHTRYQELKSLLEQKGSPTLFWTLSSIGQSCIH